MWKSNINIVYITKPKRRSSGKFWQKFNKFKTLHIAKINIKIFFVLVCIWNFKRDKSEQFDTENRTEDLLVARNEIVSIVSPNIDLKIDLCSPCVTWHNQCIYIYMYINICTNSNGKKYTCKGKINKVNAAEKNP